MSEAPSDFESAMQALQAGDMADAERWLARHVETNPDEPYGLHYLGLCLFQREDYAGAAERLQRAVALDGGREASFRGNLGLALLRLGRAAEAEPVLREAIALSPDFAAAHFSLGHALASLRRYEESIASYQQALKLDPGNEDARWALANALLLIDRYEEGWPAFEARRHAASLDEAELAKRLPANVTLLSYANYDRPRWQGEDIAGKTLLVHFEYGFGDTFQFVRYLPLLARRGVRVVFEAQGAVVALMRTLEGIGQVVARGDPLPPYDLHCPLLSLPLYFGTTPQTIPAAIPYLQADPALVAAWQRRLAAQKKFRVALAWSGNPYPLSDGRKSMGIEEFGALAGIEGVAFYGLQKRDDPALPASMQGMDWTDLSGEVKDFSDTAAILKNMDLMLTIDSGPAHLGGALGVPLWLMLPFHADWRWGLAERSAWYPAMRLFRQTTPQDWAGVLREVRAALPALVASRRPGRSDTGWLQRLAGWFRRPGN